MSQHMHTRVAPLAIPAQRPTANKKYIKWVEHKIEFYILPIFVRGHIAHCIHNVPSLRDSLLPAAAGCDIGDDDADALASRFNGHILFSCACVRAPSACTFNFRMRRARRVTLPPIAAPPTATPNILYKEVHYFLVGGGWTNKKNTSRFLLVVVGGGELCATPKT